MWKQRFSFLAIVVAFALISDTSRSASNLYSIDLAADALNSASGEVRKKKYVLSASTDAQHQCDFGSERLSPHNILSRKQMCIEIIQLRESLKRLKISINTFREFIITNENRCHRMERLANESNERVSELNKELIRANKEREQLKYLLTDFNLSAAN